VIQAIASMGKAASLDCWATEVRKISLSMSWPGISVDDRLTFRGDALELLTEFLLKSCPNHIRHGITDYTIVPLRDDYGVDATGRNVNNDSVVIQCKFRKNPLDLISYSDLARTFTSGVLSYGLDKDKNKNLWLVTTANDANRNAHKEFGRRLHVLGRSHLKSQVDGNITFWTDFLASVQKVVS